MKKIVMTVLAVALALPVFALPWEKGKVEEQTEAPKKAKAVAEATVAEDDAFHFGIGVGTDINFDGKTGIDVFGTIRKKDVLGIIGFGYNPIGDIDSVETQQFHGFAGVGYEW